MLCYLIILLAIFCLLLVNRWIKRAKHLKPSKATNRQDPASNIALVGIISSMTVALLAIVVLLFICKSDPEDNRWIFIVLIAIAMGVVFYNWLKSDRV